MFQFVVLALIAAAYAAPQNLQDVQIVRYDSDNAGLGAYNFASVFHFIIFSYRKIFQRLIIFV